MKKLTILAALAATLVATGAGATEFVKNGDFSSLGSNGLGQLNNGYTATNWATTGYNITFNDATNASGSSVALWDAYNGGFFTNGNLNLWNGRAPGNINFVALDGDYFTAPITQTITGLTVGKSYTLTFDYAFSQQKGFDGDTVQNIAASFGGAQVFKSADYSLPSHGFSGWSTETLNVTANSSSEVLSFLAHGNLPIPPFALLTGVSLTGASAVPEPATWGMMIVGLGAMGAASRLRRRRVIATA